VLGLVTAALTLTGGILWGLRAPPTVWDISVIGVAVMAAATLCGAQLARSILRSKWLDK